MIEKIFPILFSTLVTIWNPTPVNYPVYAAPAHDVPVDVIEANTTNYFIIQADQHPGDQIGEVFTSTVPAQVIGWVNLYGANLEAKQGQRNYLVPILKGVAENTWIILANANPYPSNVRVTLVDAHGKKQDFTITLPTLSRVLTISELDSKVNKNFQGAVMIQSNYAIGVWAAVCYPGQCSTIPVSGD